MKGSQYLTSPNPELDRLVTATVPGMAHWSGTGPPGATCGKCRHHMSLPNHLEKMVLKRCAKYFHLVQKVGPEPIPNKTVACRYWEKMG